MASKKKIPIKTRKNSVVAIDGPAGLVAGRLNEARAIQARALKGSSPKGPVPLGIWSRGCYWIETEERTEVYKYGTYRKRFECIA